MVACAGGNMFRNGRSYKCFFAVLWIPWAKEQTCKVTAVINVCIMGNSVNKDPMIWSTTSQTQSALPVFFPVRSGSAQNKQTACGMLVCPSQKSHGATGFCQKLRCKLSVKICCSPVLLQHSGLDQHTAADASQALWNCSHGSMQFTNDGNGTKSAQGLLNPSDSLGEKLPITQDILVHWAQTRFLGVGPPEFIRTFLQDSWAVPIKSWAVPIKSADIYIYIYMYMYSLMAPNVLTGGPPRTFDTWKLYRKPRGYGSILIKRQRSKS